MRSRISFLSLLLVVVALVAGFALAKPFDRYDPVEEAYAERVRAQTEADVAWQRISQPIRLALYAGLGGLAVVGGGMLLLAGFRCLERRARTIYPDEHGVMPAVVLRPGEILADLGALAGPARVTEQGVEYSLPPAAVPQLQGGANQGAALTRTMRAWATHEGKITSQGSPWSVLPGPVSSPAFPPVEVLTGDEAHIFRLLEDGDS